MPGPKENEGYVELAQRASAKGPVTIVAPSAGWQWDPKQPDADTVDGCHPNKKGDLKIATDFWSAAEKTHLFRPVQ